MLDKLLIMQENPKLDFKRDMYKISGKGQDVPRQKDEMIKDVLAIANGNTSFVGESGFLVIGVSDTVDGFGVREIHGVRDPLPKATELIQIVNGACDPPLDTLHCDVIIVENKRVLMIRIPPTPHVHETTRKLLTPKKEYSEHVVFIRHESEIIIASHRDRTALQQMKSFHFTTSNNVPPVLFGVGSGAFIGASMTNVLAKRFTTTDSERIGATIGGLLAGGILGGSFGSTISTLKQVMTRTKDMSIEKRILELVANIGGGIAFAVFLQRVLQLLRKFIIKPQNYF